MRRNEGECNEVYRNTMNIRRGNAGIDYRGRSERGSEKKDARYGDGLLVHI